MEIATDRLHLQEFVIEDWQSLFAYQNDPRYLEVVDRNPQTADEAQAFVRMFTDYATANPRRKFQLAVTLKGSGVLIGNCGIRRAERNEWDAELGYELSADHWGKGYATEAGAAMLEFGFEELKLHRISARTNAANEASARVLRKLGMREEGRLREADFQKGRWWDTILWGILKSEWRERQR